MTVLHSLNRLFAKWGWAVIVLLAVSYYASFFSHGLNLGGEGGTTAVIAMRLMEGQRPIVDTFLGYNVLWFYPVAWLFQVTGPSYPALRAFFFAICTLTALLGWRVVLRVAGSGILALATGIVLVLIPGMLFRNYMGLLPVANQLAMVSAFLLPGARGLTGRVLGIAASGAVLGLTYLVRIEVGLLLTVIWLGLFAVILLRPGSQSPRQWQPAIAGLGAGLLAFLAVHGPFVIDAHQRGFLREFTGQYTAFVGYFRWEIQKEIESLRKQFARPNNPPHPEPAVPQMTGTSHVSAVTPPPQSGTDVADGRRARPPVSEILTGERSRDRFFAAAVYLPLPLAGMMVLGGLVAVILAMVRRDPALWDDAWTVLVLTGCSLTLLPQYFSFRPDTPHITEFMVPFWVALSCSLAILSRRAWLSRRKSTVTLAVVSGLAVALMLFVHFGHAWPKESAGTIAARKHGPAVFEGSNGVRVYLRPDRAEAMTGLHRKIVENSQPGEWVVCYPYSPTINFMTDRPSYLWDLYTDNTLAGREFDDFHIRLAKEKQPAVVVIDHRAINNSEASRFPNWARDFYNYLTANYEIVGTFAGNEVFVRRRSP
ncbi:MAG: hypothetical protein Fur0032_20750 [Terrimicrobiaceae bacterium]